MHINIQTTWFTFTPADESESRTLSFMCLQCRYFYTHTHTPVWPAIPVLAVTSQTAGSSLYGRQDVRCSSRKRHFWPSAAPGFSCRVLRSQSDHTHTQGGFNGSVQWSCHCLSFWFDLWTLTFVGSTQTDRSYKPEWESLEQWLQVWPQKRLRHT